jgi:hypothetical protein
MSNSRGLASPGRRRRVDSDIENSMALASDFVKQNPLSTDPSVSGAITGKLPRLPPAPSKIPMGAQLPIQLKKQDPSR